MAAMHLENPVLMKEMRSRMRGARAYWILLAYNGLLCMALFFVYLSWGGSLSAADWSRTAPRFGSDLFNWMVGLQATLAILLAPAFTCGAITLEREQRTYEMLCLTLVKPTAIFLGKLTSALSYVVLLAVTSIPLVALCFLFGGVSPGELAASYLVILVTAFFLGIIGICCSTVAQRTTTATAMAYGFGMFFGVGTMLLDLLVFEMLNFGGPGQHALFMYFSPIAALASVRNPTFLGAASPSFPMWLVTVGTFAVLSIVMPFGILRRLKPGA